MHSPSEASEQLVTRCLQGDQTAFAALYDACGPLIYRLCYGLLMNRQDAEDVMQEAFVYAFRNLHRYDPARSAFKTWLYTIALSRCRNQFRRKNWQRFVGFLSTDLPAPRAERPEAQMAKHDAQAAVELALSALTPRLREAVILRYGHGLTFREMAVVMGCPQKTAESRIRLAHERLRGLLQPQEQHLLEALMGIEWA